jgi:hypothetical protein
MPLKASTPLAVTPMSSPLSMRTRGDAVVDAMSVSAVVGGGVTAVAVAAVAVATDAPPRMVAATTTSTVAYNMRALLP